MSEPEMIWRRLQVAADAGGVAISVSPLVAEFAALFRAQPAAIARMLAEHAEDGTGHCRVCMNGPQAGRQTWPCRLYEIAEQASKLLPGGLIFTSPDEGGDPDTGRERLRLVVDDAPHRRDES